jgi:hypothetical protein
MPIKATTTRKEKHIEAQNKTYEKKVYNERGQVKHNKCCYDYNYT